MDTLKFPLRFDTNKNLVKLKEGTDGYIKQLLAMCILTEPFILPLTPDFGVADPTFSVVPIPQLLIAANKYIPEIEIVDIDSVTEETSGTVNVRFTYRK